MLNSRWKKVPYVVLIWNDGLIQLGRTFISWSTPAASDTGELFCALSR